jgi:hypothetical protein
MKANHRMVSSDKVIESIRSGIRKEVVNVYTLWRHQCITKKEFSTYMYNIRLTSFSIVGSMGDMGILHDSEITSLVRFIEILTETY